MTDSNLSVIEKSPPTAQGFWKPTFVAYSDYLQLDCGFPIAMLRKAWTQASDSMGALHFHPQG
jgi:hypothetical protein